MRWLMWCVALLAVSCGKSRKVEVTAGSASASQGAVEVAPPPSPPGKLELECSDTGPDLPVADEAAGPGVPRIESARSAGLPEGWIAYVAEGKVWLVSSDGQRRRRIVGGTAPRWLPGGRWLVFVSELDDRTPGLFVAATDCSVVRPLTPLVDNADQITSCVNDGSAPRPSYEDDIFAYTISPSGKSIAFLRRGPALSSLHVLELATGMERKLVDGVHFVEPAWFPDERSIAYAAAGENTEQLLRVEVDTGQTQKLAAAWQPQVAITPHSQPLFQSAAGESFTIEDRQARLYQGDLTRSLAGSELAPGSYDILRISPDGTKLAAPWGIWTGNGPAALRDHGLSLFALSNAPSAFKRRAFPSLPDTIVFTRPKTRNLSRAASGERYSMHDPSWARDSRYLAFGLVYHGRSFIEDRGQIVAVDTNGSTGRLFFLANGTQPAWGW
jgi:hypothetical protein